jgi:tRNA (cmo5U34)-methyltransferase
MPTPKQTQARVRWPTRASSSVAADITCFAVAQLHDSPSRYLRLMREALPLYDALQEQVLGACVDLNASRVLDLGAGTGETSRRYLESHPGARVVAVDASEGMLRAAGGVLGKGVELRLGRLEDPLPEGPFELVVAVLAVHHLKGPGKADLFARIAAQLARGGRFVMGDVVVVDGEVADAAPLDPKIDFPDRVDDLLGWLRKASLEPTVRWSEGDLAVISADRR